MTIRRIIDTLLENLEIAQKDKTTKKPFSRALYWTWKTISQEEGEQRCCNNCKHWGSKDSPCGNCYGLDEWEANDGN